LGIGLSVSGEIPLRFDCEVVKALDAEAGIEAGEERSWVRIEIRIGRMGFRKMLLSLRILRIGDAGWREEN